MTQVCPNCQQPNRAEAKFCAHCRAALSGVITPAGAAPPSADSMPCPQCGKSINAKAKFCNYCGQPLTGTPAPQVALPAIPQPTPQPVPAAAPQMSNTSVPQSPPPYAPPAFTPGNGPGLSRQRKIMVSITGVVVLLVAAIVATRVIPLLSTPTITATPTQSLPTPIAPTPTATPKVTVRAQTATPLPTSSSRERENTFVVKINQTLYNIADEYCRDIPSYKVDGYAREIAKINGIDWNGGRPNISPGDILKMPPCP